MAGSYTTTSRKHILEYLKNNSEKTVTVTDISNHLKDNNCEVNITTIYRYLDKLIKEKQVMKYVTEKGTHATFQYIEHNRHCEKHLHLQCMQCGGIFHLECAFMKEIAEHIKEDHGFVIQCKNSIIYGLCEKCNVS